MSFYVHNVYLHLAICLYVFDRICIHTLQQDYGIVFQIASKSLIHFASLSMQSDLQGIFVVMLTYGTCAMQQLYPILAQTDCEQAAR